MTEAMKLLASGDSSVEIPARGRKDEVGQIADAVQVFKENAIEMERLRREQTAAEGRAGEKKQGAKTDLADRFQASVGSIVQTVSDRKNVGWGMRVSVRVELGGRRLIQKKTSKEHHSK